MSCLFFKASICVSNSKDWNKKILNAVFRILGSITKGQTIDMKSASQLFSQHNDELLTQLWAQCQVEEGNWNRGSFNKFGAYLGIRADLLVKFRMWQPLRPWPSSALQGPVISAFPCISFWLWVKMTCKPNMWIIRFTSQATHHNVSYAPVFGF